MRTRGSVRFAAYYKVQVWIEQNLSWRDVQKAWPTADEARAAFPKGARCRVMEVTEHGRAPLPE